MNTSKQFLLLATFALLSFVYAFVWYRVLLGHSLALLLALPLIVQGLWLAMAAKNQKTPSSRVTLIMMLLVIIIPTVGLMIARQSFGPSQLQHDGAVQTELAIEALLRGDNPYVVDYGFTHLKDVPFFLDIPNPALPHYVYLPANFLLPLPLHVISKKILGFFDLRLIYLLWFALWYWAIIRVSQTERQKYLLLVVTIFNPMFQFYFIQGSQNDIPIIAGLWWIFILFQQKRPWLAAFLWGLVCATKHTGPVITPLVFLALLQLWGDWFRTTKWLVVAVLCGLIFVGPFLMWDFGAFWQDTVSYVTGGTKSAYPVCGVSLAALLQRSGLVSKTTAATIPRYTLPIVILVFLFLCKRQYGKSDFGSLLLHCGVLIGIMVFLARFCQSSYVSLVSVFILPAVLLSSPPEETNHSQ